jgi:hypothetical protein
VPRLRVILLPQPSEDSGGCKLSWRACLAQHWKRARRTRRFADRSYNACSNSLVHACLRRVSARLNLGAYGVWDEVPAVRVG